MFRVKFGKWWSLCRAVNLPEQARKRCLLSSDLHSQETCFGGALFLFGSKHVVARHSRQRLEMTRAHGPLPKTYCTKRKANSIKSTSAYISHAIIVYVCRRKGAWGNGCSFQRRGGAPWGGYFGGSENSPSLLEDWGWMASLYQMLFRARFQKGQHADAAGWSRTCIVT